MATPTADLDAVTIDAHGTLVRLVDPVPALRSALAARGLRRSVKEVEAAFAAEVDHYVPRSHQGREAETLAALRLECVSVFLGQLGSDLDPVEFTPAFVEALRFEPEQGAREALDALAARGLALAVIANWDCSLPGHLQGLGLHDRLAAVVTSAETGTPKPDPQIFAIALERLGVRPDRALHVGDGDEDERGAAAAGLGFSPAPLARLLPPGP